MLFELKSMDRLHKQLLYRKLTDFVYPNVCPVCGRTIDINADFCGRCSLLLNHSESKINIPGVDIFRACYVYDEHSAKIILRLKYTRNGNTVYALARNMLITAWEYIADADMLVPVPMTKKDIRKRGYNQSELIADEISVLSCVPCINALIKHRQTGKQKSADAAERRLNIKDAFIVNDEVSLENKTVMIIDDVCTTGSTLFECASVLRGAGAGRVYALTAAKTKFDIQ